MHKQTGFTLIELLVTVLIVSVGLLGAAGVIGNGLKNNVSSYSLSQASCLAADIIERMRANRNTTEDYSLAIDAAAPTGTTVAPTDLAEWRSALSATLPSGTGEVKCWDASSTIVACNALAVKVRVTVQWNDSRAAGGLVAKQFVTETRL